MMRMRIIVLPVTIMVPGVVYRLMRALVGLFGSLVVPAFGIAPGMPFVASRILCSLVGLPVFLMGLLVLRPGGLRIMCHGRNSQQPKGQSQNRDKMQTPHAKPPS